MNYHNHGNWIHIDFYVVQNNKNYSIYYALKYQIDLVNIFNFFHIANNVTVRVIGLHIIYIDVYVGINAYI